MTDYRTGSRYKLAVAASAAVILAAIGGAVYLGIPHHQAAAGHGPRAAASQPSSAGADLVADVPIAPDLVVPG